MLHGLSDNRFKNLDISDAQELVGYAPVDDASEENAKTSDLHLKGNLDKNTVAGPQESGLRADAD